jgi:hypothetical protein
VPELHMSRVSSYEAVIIFSAGPAQHRSAEGMASAARAFR